MAIPSASGFSIGSADAIDDRLVLSKAEMKSANDNVFPPVYVCVCKDNGSIYIYNKSNEIDEETGKFRLFKTGTEFKVLVVAELPTEDIDPFTIYFMPAEKTEEGNIYDEFMNVNGSWERIGSTKIDLTPYLKTDGSNGTAEGVSNLINKLTVGESDPEDDDFIVSQYAGGGSETTSYHRRALSKFWNYIKGKISSVLGLTATNYGGKASSAGTADSAGSATKASQDENGITIHQNYMRSYQISASTMAELKAYTNSSGAFCGSASISDGPAGNCWYNLLWIPHRNGIGGDNADYGRLFMFPMTVDSSDFYIYQKKSTSWSGAVKYGPNTQWVSGYLSGTTLRLYTHS